MENLISNLFRTKAIKACEADSPFWLTSGKIGAYFINAEFLYGSEEKSKELLTIIDKELVNPQKLPKRIFDQVWEQYNSNDIYKYTIDTLMQIICQNVNLNEIDFVSGGERRDWVFSNIIAYLLKKPHITIFKDLSVLVSSKDFNISEKVESLEGKKCLHVSDLITEAASYINLWLPAIEQLEGQLKWTATIVDRMQGGTDRLAEQGVLTYSLVKVDRDLFRVALENKSITQEQYSMIDKYMSNPYDTMRGFLITHPKFLRESLKGTGKTLIRAKKCVEEDIYGLGDLIKNEEGISC